MTGNGNGYGGVMGKGKGIVRIMGGKSCSVDVEVDFQLGVTILVMLVFLITVDLPERW
jgi:hypothetical protein